MTVNVRFAPSPTGVLHIGSVRTALFNWLYARHNKGNFFLRIEDTDKLRSTEENTRLIFKILEWLHIDWDGDPVIQSSRIERHKEVALDLVNKGKAYYCYCTPEELANKKEKCLKENKPYKYDGKCRNGNNNHDRNIKPVIRLKSEQEGITSVNDMVQGEVTVNNSQLDDLVLIRSDGTPTYMLSVVVDDHDMNVTHVIRGDDHLTNTFRQIQIYKACGWEVPKFGHIPLIYGPDGAKLSKRHGAASAIDYMQLGYLPEAIFNYLLRLGWSHGNEEIISKEQAIEWFDISNVGQSPARFDMAKLQNLNAHYMKERMNESLLEYTLPFFKCELSNENKQNILRGMNSLKERSKTIVELADASMIYVRGPENYEDKCSKYATEMHLNFLEEIAEKINNEKFSIKEEELCNNVREFANSHNIKLVEIAQAMRGALCGKLTSPSVFEIISIIGKEETINRFNSYIKYYKK